MRSAAAIFLCAGLLLLASNAYADDNAPASSAPAAQVSASTDTAAKAAQTATALSSEEQADLMALNAESGALLERQSAGRECNSSADTDCTHTTDCSRQIIVFGIVGVLAGSFGGAAGAVVGGVAGAAVGYAICGAVAN